MGCRPKMKALKWSDQTSLELALGWAGLGEAQRRCRFPGRSVLEWRMGGLRRREHMEPAKGPVCFPMAINT